MHSILEAYHKYIETDPRIMNIAETSAFDFNEIFETDLSGETWAQITFFLMMKMRDLGMLAFQQEKEEQ